MSETQKTHKEPMTPEQFDTLSREIPERLAEESRTHSELVAAVREGIAEVPRDRYWRAHSALHDLEGQYQAALDALREACLHQGLPEDAPTDRIAAHFRNNREFRDSFPAKRPS